MAVSMGIIFVLSPMLGAMTDRAPRRMPFLVGSTLICVLLTMLFGRLNFYITAVLFIIANAAYQAGLQFYDALLAEVSTEDNRGKIGGIGVGVGYLGSYIAVGMSLMFGMENKPFLFLVFALAFLAFSLPCIFFVKERGNPRPRPINLSAMRDSLVETIRTLRSGSDYPGLLRFLIGRVFYTDAINTVINMMVLYTVNVAVRAGFEKNQAEQRANVILMFAITFAIAGGFFWGWLTDRFGPKRTLNYVLRMWMAIFILASLVGMVGLPLWTMYVVAASAGFALGGVWAADRPFMLRLTPPGRIGEFYGLYGMVGRFSAITGPIVWATVTSLAIRGFGRTPLAAQGMAVLVLLVLVMASYVILQPVSDTRRDWKEGDLAARAGDTHRIRKIG
jgi:UMF1 family MFS transporter